MIRHLQRIISPIVVRRVGTCKDRAMTDVLTERVPFSKDFLFRQVICSKGTPAPGRDAPWSPIVTSSNGWPSALGRGALRSGDSIWKWCALFSRDWLFKLLVRKLLMAVKLTQKLVKKNSLVSDFPRESIRLRCLQFLFAPIFAIFFFLKQYVDREEKTNNLWDN